MTEPNPPSQPQPQAPSISSAAGTPASATGNATRIVSSGPVDTSRHESTTVTHNTQSPTLAIVVIAVLGMIVVLIIALNMRATPGPQFADVGTVAQSNAPLPNEPLAAAPGGAPPTETPSTAVTSEATPEDTPEASPEATQEVHAAAVESPTVAPAEEPTVEPTLAPTDAPTVTHTPMPTAASTATSTETPIETATETPTETPTETMTHTPVPTAPASPIPPPAATPTAINTALPAPGNADTPAVGTASSSTFDIPTAEPGTVRVVAEGFGYPPPDQTNAAMRRRFAVLAATVDAKRNLLAWSNAEEVEAVTAMSNGIVDGDAVRIVVEGVLSRVTVLSETYDDITGEAHVIVEIVVPEP